MSITPRIQEILEDLPLRADDAWYALLVYLGLKSGAWVSLESSIWREGDEPKKVPQSTVEIVEASLAALGLVYATECRDTDAGIWQSDNGATRQRFNQIIDVYMAKDQATLDTILLARKNNDHKLLGRALGYPDTAVAAFGTDNRILVSQLEPKVQLSEVGQLTYFALSKENWKSELKTVEAWIAALKDASSTMWHELRRFANVIDEEFVELAIRSKE